MKKAIYIFILSLVAFAACEETDRYYEVLKDQPQLIKNYDRVYSVGDTLSMRGRFNPEGLQIRIGDAGATIVSESSSTGEIKTWVIKVLISEAMGIGVDRPVSITSSGITIEGPVIEIVEDANSGVLHGELTVQKIADYPTNTTPVYCHSGKGNLYFLHNETYTITRITPDGTARQVFDISKCRDADGTAFTFTRFNSCGIDPAERYLYLSLYTEAPFREYWHYYRLCRYNLKNGEFIVLNKTPYYIYRSRRTLSDVKPFEGNIADVKMFTATAVYPDSLGNVYFDMDKRMITHLDANGNYTYVFKNTFTLDNYTLSDPAPEIVDPETDTYYSKSRTFQVLPGVLHDFQDIQAIDPAGDQLYIQTIRNLLERYDLGSQVAVNGFNKTLIVNSPNNKPYISGSFNVLTGQSIVDGNKSFWGKLPLPDGKLLVLYYQDLIDSEFYRATYLPFKLPAWGVLDFKNERGYRYAPGAFDRQGYVMSSGDVLLNYDADGMLYMTANNKSVILKTSYK